MEWKASQSLDFPCFVGHEDSTSLTTVLIALQIAQPLDPKLTSSQRFASSLMLCSNGIMTALVDAAGTKVPLRRAKVSAFVMVCRAWLHDANPRPQLFGRVRLFQEASQE